MSSFVVVLATVPVGVVLVVWLVGVATSSMAKASPQAKISTAQSQDESTLFLHAAGLTAATDSAGSHCHVDGGAFSGDGGASCSGH